MDFNGQNITERIFKITEILEIKDINLAKELGVSRHNMPKYRNKILSIPAWRVIIFLSRHREINTDWIIFGEGEMFAKPGTHRMEMDKNGAMTFTSHSNNIKAENEEIKRLNSIIEEKEKQIEMQSDFIEKLLGKIK